LEFGEVVQELFDLGFFLRLFFLPSLWSQVLGSFVVFPPSVLVIVVLPLQDDLLLELQQVFGASELLTVLPPEQVFGAVEVPEQVFGVVISTFTSSFVVVVVCA
jgi:hypothetical protein